jgi:hypothetical protein
LSCCRRHRNDQITGSEKEGDDYVAKLEALTAAANEADVEVVHELLHGKEQVVYADSGYLGADKRVRRKKLEWQIAAKRGKIKARDHAVRAVEPVDGATAVVGDDGIVAPAAPEREQSGPETPYPSSCWRRKRAT